MAFCSTPEQGQAEIEEYIATSNGLQILGNWGAQCTLYAQRYSRALFGISEYSTLGYGNARDHITNANSNYFEIIWNDPSKPNLLPKRGDLLIYNGKPLWDGKLYGHVGIGTKLAQAVATLQQLDGATAPNRLYPDGYYYSVAPVHSASFPYVGSPGVGDIRGWIRPKWQKIVYSGADKRGYGAASLESQTEVVPGDIQNFIDISDWQEADVVRKVDTDAVVIKASESTNWRSQKMDAHVKEARKKGIPYMFYHFARATKNDSDSEAKFFLSVVDKYMGDPLFAGLVLDWEEDSVMHYAVWASDFLAYIRRNSPGTHLVIYTRAAFLGANGWRPIDKTVPVWLAAYGTDQPMNGYATDFKGAPKGSNGFTVAAWQYTQRGRLPGYPGDLDLNRDLTGTMWPDTDDLLEWIVKNEDKVREIIVDVIRKEGAQEMRGSANDILSPNGVFGTQALDNIATAVHKRPAPLANQPGKTTDLETKITWLASEQSQVKDLANKNYVALATVKASIDLVGRVLVNALRPKKENNHG